MDILYTILITLATLALLVAIHEYGHFWVARRCGVHVLRFSIGFGKALYTWRDRRGTEYCIAAIPLGGYVKMLGEHTADDIPAEQLDGAFDRKPVLQRIAIVSAGPLANLALAVVAYWFLYLSGESGYVPIVDRVEPESVAELAGLQPGEEIVAVDGVETPTWQALNFRLLDRIGDTGTLRLSVKYPGTDLITEKEAPIDHWLYAQEKPDLLGGLGVRLYTPDFEPLIGEVLPGSPAASAGLKAGDLLLSADGIAMPLWNDWVDYVRARPGQTVELEVARDGQRLVLYVVPKLTVIESGEQIGRVGVGVAPPEMPEELIRRYQRGPLEALGAAVVRTGELTVFTLESIYKMLTGLISPKNLSGPITIAQVATASAESGFESYIGFLALLSVSLGVLNLLPIPVLDGGHLLFYTVELLAGRPVPEKIQALGYQMGLFLVLGIMVLALYNDIARL
ncbi:MAG: RIP metalloprotease RseP [Gammaproteobacteria bacterium]|nr:RIP metalloprotease RseP [Gammaproteobacteria bacterium]